MIKREVYKLKAKYGKLDNEVIFTQDPRFGRYSVSFSKGGIPAELSGSWDSLDRLKAKVERYLATRKDNKASLGEKIEDIEDDPRVSANG